MLEDLVEKKLYAQLESELKTLDMSEREQETGYVNAVNRAVQNEDFQAIKSLRKYEHISKRYSVRGFGSYAIEHKKAAVLDYLFENMALKESMPPSWMEDLGRRPKPGNEETFACVKSLIEHAGDLVLKRKESFEEFADNQPSYILHYILDSAKPIAVNYVQGWTSAIKKAILKNTFSFVKEIVERDPKLLISKRVEDFLVLALTHGRTECARYFWDLHPNALPVAQKYLDKNKRSFSPDILKLCHEKGIDLFGGEKPVYQELLNYFQIAKTDKNKEPMVRAHLETFKELTIQSETRLNEVLNWFELFRFPRLKEDLKKVSLYYDLENTTQEKNILSPKKIKL